MLKRFIPSVLFVLTLAVFVPAVRYDWIYQWDDGPLLVMNPLIRAWSWQWMLFGFPDGHWMPLSSFLATVEYHLWGLHPVWWHAFNIVLHAGNAVLLYFITRRLLRTEFGAFVSAVLFAVHPLRLEAVAWIVEVRMLLMGTFVLASLLLWLHAKLCSCRSCCRCRAGAFGAFVVACLAHPLAVTLPVWFVLLDWYQIHGSRVWRIMPDRQPRQMLLRSMILRRTAPFFGVALVRGLIEIWGLRGLHNTLAWSVVGLGPRFWHVAYSQVYYAAQTVWPSRLSHFIEYTWAASWNQVQYPLAVLAIVGATIVCLRTRRRWPAITAACLAYTTAILPVNGLFQSGPQFVANRYSYLASLPLMLLVGAAAELLWRRWRTATAVSAATVTATLILVTLTAMPMWRDSASLWRYSARHERNCTLCADMAARADYVDGDLAGARRHLEHAIAVSDTTALPRWERHWNLATLLLKMGEREQAIRELRTYLVLIPAERRETLADKRRIEAAQDALARLARERRW